MEKIVSLCKRRGFIFQSSEIYGGINGFWDYGPLGAELKRNVKDFWWRCMTVYRDDVVGLDASIIMHPRTWEASGHTSTFSDPMVDCLLTRKRLRLDQIDPQTGTAYSYLGAVDRDLFFEFQEQNPGSKLIEAFELHSDDGILKPRPGTDTAQTVENLMSSLDLTCNTAYSVLIPDGERSDQARKIARKYYQLRGITRPLLIDEQTEHVENSTRYNPENGSLLTEPREFNLMFKTYVGPVESEDNIAYLRPETAQAIFAQFKTVLEVSRQKLPFGICQIGKAFRNEINPRNFTFRSREFEQMELEFFIKPDEIAAKSEADSNASPDTPQPNWGWKQWHEYWVEERIRWYESVGLTRDSLDVYWQPAEELAHYAQATVDILYKFPFGTQELEGIAARGNFDLTQHQEFSGKSMEYFDEEAKTRYVPHVIEPSAGVDRLILAIICQAYREEEIINEKGKKEIRNVMQFHPRIAPIKVAVFPLLKNRRELVMKAKEVRDLLRPYMQVFYDDAGAIGRRYRRQDEAGTPFCVTIDFETLGETPELLDTVTVRDRDTMKQDRIHTRELAEFLQKRFR
ncbi:MAG: glycine--tRNA ligase [Verrucomicrobia bacterium]|nr:glycine--tRNA ligase [Verrucomicrobiota bacterium]MCF7708133.1 glycine--tRNA ligase [Verrucomicrobiota bacterium]